MNEIIFDTTNFSEQLGIYDFFNIIIAGTVFIFGLCTINTNIYTYIWSNVTFAKGLGIVILIYITGLILQEIGSIADKKVFKFYEGITNDCDEYELPPMLSKRNFRHFLSSLRVCALSTLNG